MTTEAASDLLATLGDLWPGAVVRAGRDSRAIAEYVALPSADAPRILVPAGNPRDAARAVLRFSADSSSAEVARRVAGATWLRAARLRGLPRVTVAGADGDTGSLREHLSHLLGTEVTFSVGLGTARVNRKPVLEVYDGAGSTLAFAKLGVSAQSRQDVRAEAAALRQIAQHSWREFETPRVLHIGRWHNFHVLLLSPLPTVPRWFPIGPARPPLRAMSELESAYAEPPRPLGDLPWLHRVRESLAGLADQERATRALACLDRLVEEADAHLVTVGAWHGDWTPWNMSTSGGRVRVWDWERFETGVPTGLDAFHFRVNAATRAHGTSPATVLEALRLSDPSATRNGTTAHVRAGLYLLAITARYLPLAEGPRGADIAPRGLCMLEALDDWTR